jgi:CheY-like chemotaxis protein
VICSPQPDGLAAIKHFADFAPDLVITDISMPGMDGVTAAGLMREISQEKGFVCRIYALTGLGTSDPRLRSTGLGGSAALDGWLVKGKDDLRAIRKIAASVAHEKANRQP